MIFEFKRSAQTVFFWSLLSLSLGCGHVETQERHAILAGVTSSQNKMEGINPSNRVLEQPSRSYEVEYRPELILQSTGQSLQNTRTVIRPNFSLQNSEFVYSSPSAQKRVFFGRVNLYDAFTEISFSTQSRSFVGLQSFQWGPADLLNVSNPNSHFRNRSRSLLRQEKGQILLRYSYSPTIDFNLSAVANLASNQETPFRANQKFKQHGYLKMEQTTSSGLSYLGTSLGYDESQKPFLGPYLTLGSSIGFSLYIDSRAVSGSQIYRPNLQTSQMDLIESNGPGFQSLLGLRYEGDYDMRTEFYQNSLGYSRTEFSNSLFVLQTSNPQNAEENFKRFFSNGLEFYSEKTVLFSVRKSRFLGNNDWTFSYRHIRALMDDSRTHGVSMEWPLGPQGQMIATFNIFEGQSFQEWTLTRSSLFELLAQYSF